MISVMTEKFKQAYNIGQKVCVDEHMVKGKGKNPFKQKRTKGAPKSGNWLVHAVDICMIFKSIQGKVVEILRERGLAHRVVTDLVMQLCDKETVVYIDNFFTSIFPYCKS